MIDGRRAARSDWIDPRAQTLHIRTYARLRLSSHTDSILGTSRQIGRTFQSRTIPGPAKLAPRSYRLHIYNFFFLPSSRGLYWMPAVYIYIRRAGFFLFLPFAPSTRRYFSTTWKFHFIIAPQRLPLQWQRGRSIGPSIGGCSCLV